MFLTAHRLSRYVRLCLTAYMFNALQIKARVSGKHKVSHDVTNNTLDQCWQLLTKKHNRYLFSFFYLPCFIMSRFCIKIRKKGPSTSEMFAFFRVVGTFLPLGAYKIVTFAFPPSLHLPLSPSKRTFRAVSLTTFPNFNTNYSYLHLRFVFA